MPTVPRPDANSRPPALAGLYSVHARLALVLVASLLGFAVLFVVQLRGQHRQVEVLFDERERETARVLENVLELRARGPAAHADDYSRWGEMVSFVKTRDPEWGRVNLEESIATFDANVAWVLDERFRQVYVANPESLPGLDVLPLPIEEVVREFDAHPFHHFFAKTPAGVMEMWSSSIRPSDDFERRGPRRGYYVIGRRWSPELLTSLAQVTGGEPTLVAPRPAGARTESSPETGVIELFSPLPGISGEPVADLRFRASFPVATRVQRALTGVLTILLLGAFVTVLVVALALAAWVRKPLATITRALEQDDPTPLAEAELRDDEFGRLAGLVEDFFHQRDELARAREAAEEAVRAKSQFLANISHELRTPMHGILSYARFGLRDARDVPPEELEDYFRNIDDCGNSLTSLLDDLLDLAKFEAGRMSMAIAEVSLPDVVSDAADEFASLYSEMGVSLSLELDDAVPELPADRTRLLQVLRNLLSNAVKFSPPGGQVVVSLRISGDIARLCVTDQGRGIPPDELEHIFDKFVQASGTHPRTGGTGLGLAISREIVEAHGGRIWAENRPEGGARMVFEIPLSGPPARAEEVPEEPKPRVNHGRRRTDPKPPAADAA